MIGSQLLMIKEIIRKLMLANAGLMMTRIEIWPYGPKFNIPTCVFKKAIDSKYDNLPGTDQQ